MNINQVWPEWNEDCVLGEGSFGKVYRAKRVEYGRTFYSAIKVITVPKSQQEIRFARSQGMNDREIYDYFRSLVDNLLNEITLMDNLKGAKNIVGIEDYKIIEHEGEIGWDIFIRMELLTPFDSFISNPEFSQKDVIKLGVDICSALEICEQNYIVHRDIKPDNIFISRFGEYKLGDFGIARKLEATRANLSRKGTLNYMAPEVYKSEEYGSNVDLYSLGLVLYTLLNNNRIAFLPPYPQPISYTDNEEALAKRLSGAPIPYPCNASASLGAVIVKACAFNAYDRYQSATELKNDLIREWNALVQSGDNREVNSGVMHYGTDIDSKLHSTTNDMSSNGRVVVNGYDPGTTVLDQSMGYGQYQTEYPGGEITGENTSAGGIAGVKIPQSYANTKSSKLCRILAWPFAVALLVISIVFMVMNPTLYSEQTLSVAMLGIGASILISDRNKIAVGVSVFALSSSYIIEGISALIDGLQSQIPVNAIVTTLAGLLVLFGAIAIILQRDVKLGGLMCLYAVVAEWLYFIYQMINGRFTVETAHIYFAIAAVSVFVWSYGYKKNEELKTLDLVTYTVTDIFAALVGMHAISFLTTSIIDLL